MAMGENYTDRACKDSEYYVGFCSQDFADECQALGFRIDRWQEYLKIRYIIDFTKLICYNDFAQCSF